MANGLAHATPEAGVSIHRSVAELPDDALALMAQAERQRVEFGADWHALLIDTVYARDGQAGDVRFFVLRAEGRVLAVLPTYTRAHELRALSNFYSAIFAPALNPAATAQALLPLTRALRHGGTRAASYHFSPMDPASHEFAALRDALALAGLSTHSFFAFGNWYEPVQQSWAEYLATRSSKMRNTIKRMGKKFAAEGGSLEIIQGGERLQLAVDAYLSVYAHSWKVAEPYPDFIPGLCALCARRGWLRMGVAWLNGVPTAAQLWIVSNGRANIVKVAYDERFKALTSGTLVTALLMEHALDVDRVSEVDYLIGDDPYKATWMSSRRERHGLVAYDLWTWRGLLGFARQAVGAAWRRMRPPAKKADGAALTD